MKTEISQAIEYYKTHAYSMQEVAKMFNIDRKTLSRNLKNLGIDTSIISKEKFILISQQIHNGKYNYSLVHNFNNVKEKVKIICPIHGEFEQDVYSHKKGCGCPKCAREYVAQIKIKDKQKYKDFKYNPSIYFAGITECYNISIKNEIICVDLTHQH